MGDPGWVGRAEAPPEPCGPGRWPGLEGQDGASGRDRIGLLSAPELVGFHQFLLSSSSWKSHPGRLIAAPGSASWSKGLLCLHLVGPGLFPMVGGGLHVPTPLPGQQAHPETPTHLPAPQVPRADVQGGSQRPAQEAAAPGPHGLKVCSWDKWLRIRNLGEASDSLTQTLLLCEGGEAVKEELRGQATACM